VSSLSFAGNGEVVTVPDAASLDIATNDPMTLAFWINYGSGTHIIGKRDLSCAGINYQIASIESNIIHFNGSGGVVNASASFTVGAWQHIAVTYDTSTLTLYKDGTNVGSAPYSFSASTNDGPFTMGNVADCGSSLAGLLDDVRFYRAALSASQVAELATPPEADLSIVKSDTRDPVTVGDTFTYGVQVTNAGPDNASDVTLTDQLPAEVAYASSSASRGSCAHDSGVVTCDLGTLGVGVTSRARILINVTAVSPGEATNQASVTAHAFDPTAPNEANTTTTINAQPNGESHLLTVQRLGNGRGSVASNPAGIACGRDCTEVYGEGATVVLRARPRAGTSFTGWGGDCAAAGTDPTCTLVMDTDKTVTATFALV
jgi:uncharacterized repeat protein (TIGR01451 family)/uncharacterized repeat protein (TIGR02543 family)